ncbi:DUF6767 domain-containing protein [Corynebacterium durum]
MCVPGATGPHDCTLVALVREDPDLPNTGQQWIRGRR